jgi:hypothetical protein
MKEGSIWPRRREFGLLSIWVLLARSSSSFLVLSERVIWYR